MILDTLPIILFVLMSVTVLYKLCRPLYRFDLFTAILTTCAGLTSVARGIQDSNVKLIGIGVVLVLMSVYLFWEVRQNKKQP